MIMHERNMVKTLRAHYEPNKFMARRFRKAAKKRRVRKKWLARFGPDTDWRNEFWRAESFMDFVPGHDFDGGSYQIPVPP